MVIDTSTELIRDPVSALEDCRLAFVGCGEMAEAMIAGLLRKKLISADNVVGSHPRVARREELHVKYGINMFEHNRDAVLAAVPGESHTGSMVILAVKPQRLVKVLGELKGSIHPAQLVVSIVAGAKMHTITDEPRPAPKRYSAQAAAFASLSTISGMSMRPLSRALSGSERQARCGENRTTA